MATLQLDASPPGLERRATDIACAVDATATRDQEILDILTDTFEDIILSNMESVAAHLATGSPAEVPSIQSIKEASILGPMLAALRGMAFNVDADDHYAVLGLFRTEGRQASVKEIQDRGRRALQILDFGTTAHLSQTTVDQIQTIKGRIADAVAFCTQDYEEGRISRKSI